MKFQVVRLCVLGLGAFFIFPFAGHSNPLGSTEHSYPASLLVHLQELRQKYEVFPDDPDVLIQLASAYLDAGDEVYRERGERLEAYQAGADCAKRALALGRAQQAEAHFLYAANLGHIAQLKGVLVSAFLIREIKGHVEQSLELAPNHAPALHMMGMILDGLPWFLGGDAQGALSYLERAIAADPNYTHARLNLGKLYLKHGRVDEAREQFSLVMKTRSPRSFSVWSHRHHPEAVSLLRQLDAESDEERARGGQASATGKRK